MQFTPQQLTGGAKYNHKVRCGNWSEDQELEEIKLKDYLKQKEMGGLSVTLKQQQLESSLVQEKLSPTQGGLLHFGDRVMMFNHQSKGFLSANPHDTSVKAYDAFVLTTSPNRSACSRNVFTLERADPFDGFDGDVIHYGQKVRCTLLPFSQIIAPAYLHSELVTAMAASKFSRHQEVTAMAAPTGETLWEMLHPDTSDRFDSAGEPVSAGSPIVMKHVQTGSFMASDEIPYQNLFGKEFEVHCFHYFSLGKSQMLTAEMKGEITGESVLRRHGLPNIWSVVTASHDVDLLLL
jgi:hypothetical protein